MIQNYMPICFEIYRCQSSDQERFRKDKKDYYDYDGGDCYPCYCQYHSKNCFQHQQTPILWLNKQKCHEWKPEWIFSIVYLFQYFNQMWQTHSHDQDLFYKFFSRSYSWPWLYIQVKFVVIDKKVSKAGGVIGKHQLFTTSNPRNDEMSFQLYYSLYFPINQTKCDIDQRKLQN